MTQRFVRATALWGTLTCAYLGSGCKQIVGLDTDHLHPREVQAAGGAGDAGLAGSAGSVSGEAGEGGRAGSAARGQAGGGSPGGLAVAGAAGADPGAGGIDAGAGSGVGGATEPTPSFHVGGSISGLRGTLILELNGGSPLSVSSNGPFQFAGALSDGASYIVTLEQPVGQRCAPTHASGTIRGADVSNVSVSCVNDDPSLSNLEISTGALAPAFSPGVFAYQVDVGLAVRDIVVTPLASDSDASVAVNDTVLGTGSSSASIPLVLGANPIRVDVTAAAGSVAHYTLQVNRAASILEEAYLKAGNPNAVGYFGGALALSGDTLAVGAPYESAAGFGDLDSVVDYAGAVYVFVRGPAGWSQQAYVKASNVGVRDFFGQTLALVGDTLVVGAPGEASAGTGLDADPTDDSAPRAGAVYVFTRSAGVWRQQAYLKASNAYAGDEFGSSVALSVDTLAVGAPSEQNCTPGVDAELLDYSCPEAGAVYVFARDASPVGWHQEAYVKASNTDWGDRFGNALALSGETLVAAAEIEASSATTIDGDQFDNELPRSGAAYVFTREQGSWSQQAYIKPSISAYGGYFGDALALDGDTLVVAAPGQPGLSGQGPAAGAVLVFVRVGSSWAEQQIVTSSNAEAYDAFGGSVALFGDALLVGAPGESSAGRQLNGDGAENGAQASGAAYLFTRAAGSWTQQVFLKASNADPMDYFGTSVALENGTFAVGAPQEDSLASGVGGDALNNNGTNTGAVYVRSY